MAILKKQIIHIPDRHGSVIIRDVYVDCAPRAGAWIIFKGWHEVVPRANGENWKLASGM